MNGRTGKQCRERYCNHLNKNIYKGAWTQEEDELIYEKHKELGNKWAKIAEFLPQRTDNAVKNRWNSNLKRKYERIPDNYGHLIVDAVLIPKKEPIDEDSEVDTISNQQSVLKPKKVRLSDNYDDNVDEITNQQSVLKPKKERIYEDSEVDTNQQSVLKVKLKIPKKDRIYEDSEVDTNHQSVLTKLKLKIPKKDRIYEASEVDTITNQQSVLKPKIERIYGDSEVNVDTITDQQNVIFETIAHKQSVTIDPVTRKKTVTIDISEKHISEKTGKLNSEKLKGLKILGI